MPCGIRIGLGNLTMGGAPLAQFANASACSLAASCSDRTGLTGTYDIDLTWTPDQMPQRPRAPAIAAADQRRRRRSERSVALHRGAGAARAEAGFAARAGRDAGDRSRREADRKLDESRRVMRHAAEALRSMRAAAFARLRRRSAGVDAGAARSLRAASPSAACRFPARRSPRPRAISSAATVTDQDGVFRFTGARRRHVDDSRRDARLRPSAGRSPLRPTRQRRRGS